MYGIPAHIIRTIRLRVVVRKEVVKDDAKGETCERSHNSTYGSAARVSTNNGSVEGEVIREEEHQSHQNRRQTGSGL